MRIELARDQMVTVREPRPGMRISCRTGVVWLTRTGDRTDYILGAEDEFIAPCGGTIVIEACRAAQVELADPLPQKEKKRHRSPEIHPIDTSL